MEDILENKLICRICLKVVDQSQQSFGNIEDETGTLRDMMLCCIPEMDIYVSSNPILCFPCIQALVGLYNFKTKCINTETIIKTYMQRHNISEFGNVNLTSVVRDLIQINNLQKQMHEKRIMEAKQNALAKSTVEPNRTTKPAEDTSQMPMEQSTFTKDNLSTSIEQSIVNDSQPAKESQEPSEVVSSVESRNIVNDEIIKKSEVQNGSESVQKGEAASSNVESDERDNSAKGKSNSDVVTISKDDIYRETDDEDNSVQNSGENDTSLQDRSVPAPVQKMETDHIVMSNNTTVNPKLPESTPNNVFAMNYQCFNCTFVTDASENFIKHRETCKDVKEKVEHKCPHCPYVTPRRYVLTQHINSQHTKEIWYQCPDCDYKCTDKSYLKKHGKIHVEGSELEERTCEYCDFRTLSEYNFRKHLSKHDIQVLQCEFCSYSTNDRTNFRRHLFTHNPVPSDCDFCDYKSVSPYHMRNHLKKYHNGVGVEDLDLRKDQPIMELVDEIRAAVKDANQIRV